MDFKDTFIDASHVIESFPSFTDIVFVSDGDDHHRRRHADAGDHHRHDLVEVIVKKEGKLVMNDATVPAALPPPPYIITFECASSANISNSTGSSSLPLKRKQGSVDEDSTQQHQQQQTPTSSKLIVKQYTRPNAGPYPEDIAPNNTVRYTATQIEAIRSGTHPGLTMIVGPPGTGKTDVAVQIIVNLYHNYPTQKILIVTHSNAALNDLFEKIMQRDVAPRHLLRLGSGELELRETLSSAGAGGQGRGRGEVFSKQGRVNWSLTRRLQLLAQVQRLSTSIHVVGDVGSSCETAAYFHLQYIQSRIEKFYIDVSIASAAIAKSNSVGIASSSSGGSSSSSSRDGDDDTAMTMINTERRKTIRDLFPFTAFFSDVMIADEKRGTLFSDNGVDWERDLEAAKGCFTHINRIFDELADYRAFELLRTQSLRGDYLLTKQVGRSVGG